MASLYESLSGSFITLDAALLEFMRKRIDEETKTLDDKIADAEENLGESEVREALPCKVFVLHSIGDKTGLAEADKLDRYLQPHFRYYTREVRTVVYSQFLSPTRGVISFIAGKLHCKIDKVAGVLRPTDLMPERFYQATIKQGDFRQPNPEAFSSPPNILSGLDSERFETCQPKIEMAKLFRVWKTLLEDAKGIARFSRSRFGNQDEHARVHGSIWKISSGKTSSLPGEVDDLTISWARGW
ncbi:hypothetical protein HPP92_024322 [Vanilla planifolia]|uniref:Uncharacterized protein n=1 Tax=Vanilla planifolia TaxID=51239 RepID=A0A835UB82_VANPL|nr:hypothetical protein HPP92_024322 [Vanilla planifolia]